MIIKASLLKEFFYGIIKPFSGIRTTFFFEGLWDSWGNFSFQTEKYFYSYISNKHRWSWKPIPKMSSISLNWTVILRVEMIQNHCHIDSYRFIKIQLNIMILSSPPTSPLILGLLSHTKHHPGIYKDTIIEVLMRD